MKKANRRSFIRDGVTAAAAVTVAAVPTTAAAQAEKPTKKVHYRNGRKPENPPLFNGTVSYLNDLKDYAGMNEMFQGRFGADPPVRTTIAAAGGIPGNSLVEIDVIAVI